MMLQPYTDHPMPDFGPHQPLGGLRFNGHKFGPFALGDRERSRLAWRARVDAAARAWGVNRVVGGPFPAGGGVSVYDAETDEFTHHSWPAYDALTAALAAPRPWRSARKPDPRRRYSRSHRRACKGCRLMGRWLRSAPYVECFNHDEPYRARFNKFTRNPHGRSGR